MTTEKADMIFASLPYRIMHEFQIPVYDADARARRGLLRRGWRRPASCSTGARTTPGLFMKYLRRGSGYYIDVGASELVANGDDQARQRARSTELTEDAVVLEDGTELPADLVVYATGYGSMNGWAADIISQEVADKVGKVWGLGSDTTKDPGPWEGEQRNMWKPTQQEALWFHGGNLHQSRYYSLYLALQLKARDGGHPDAGLRAAGGPPHVVTSPGCRQPEPAVSRRSGRGARRCRPASAALALEGDGAIGDLRAAAMSSTSRAWRPGGASSRRAPARGSGPCRAVVDRHLDSVTGAPATTSGPATA